MMCLPRPQPLYKPYTLHCLSAMSSISQAIGTPNIENTGNGSCWKIVTWSRSKRYSLQPICLMRSCTLFPSTQASAPHSMIKSTRQLSFPAASCTYDQWLHEPLPSAAYFRRQCTKHIKTHQNISNHIKTHQNVRYTHAACCMCMHTECAVRVYNAPNTAKNVDKVQSRTGDVSHQWKLQCWRPRRYQSDPPGPQSDGPFPHRRQHPQSADPYPPQ